MTRMKIGVLGATVGLVLVAAGCGSTSDVSGGGAGKGVKNLGFGSQICGQAEAKPGFANGVKKISGGASNLSGAGSTFVAPMMSVWAKNYANTNEVQVAYQSIGSGGGVKQFSAQTVDFGASDTPMQDDELKAAKGGATLHIPLVLGAVVPTYHLKGIGSGLKFDAETLGKMFAGKIKTWNDPALSKLNPGVKLPDTPIAIAHRSDGSGTTAVWTDFLTKESPSWVQALGGKDRSFGKEVAWPTGIGGKGNEGVSGVVNQTDGGLGYVELAYALAQKLPYGSVKNKAGKFIQPCVATITKGAKGVTYPADLRASLTDGPDPDAYPITGTTYALVYVNQNNKGRAASLVNFLSWVLTTGQDQTAAINYAPLSPDLQKKSMAQVRKITLNGKPLAR